MFSWIGWTSLSLSLFSPSLSCIIKMTVKCVIFCLLKIKKMCFRKRSNLQVNSTKSSRLQQLFIDLFTDDFIISLFSFISLG